MEKIVKLRTRIILCAIYFSLGIFIFKAFAFGWPFHFPEIEGGFEMPYENMKDEFYEIQKSNEEYQRYKEEIDKKMDEKYCKESFLRFKEEIEKIRKDIEKDGER
jgi:hypothetical protein